MSLLLLALAAASSPAANPARCAARVRTVVDQRRLPAIHPLTAEPPATHILAVERLINHCPKPVVLRREVGAPAETSPVR